MFPSDGICLSSFQLGCLPGCHTFDSLKSDLLSHPLHSMKCWWMSPRLLAKRMSKWVISPSLRPQLTEMTERLRSYMYLIHAWKIILPHVYHLWVEKLCLFLSAVTRGPMTPDFLGECLVGTSLPKCLFSTHQTCGGSPDSSLLGVGGSRWVLVAEQACRVRQFLAPAREKIQWMEGSRFLLCWAADKKPNFGNPGGVEKSEREFVAP